MLQGRGDLKPLEGTKYMLHPQATQKGGLQISDKGNIIPDLIKHVSKGIGSKILKGEFHDLLKTPTPAWFHQETTHLHLQQNELS